MSAVVWAIVPVKPFSIAKQRLAPVLSPVERARLARVMLEDVLDALVASQSVLARIVVVTADREPADIARRRRATVVLEAAPAGVNAAVNHVVGRLNATSEVATLVAPADLPQLSPAAIAEVIGCLAPPSAAVLIPASADGGTNLMACRPPGLIAAAFGRNSFERHYRAARHVGIAPHVIEGGSLGLDIDRPDDLLSFLSMGTSTRTHALLNRLRISERLAESDRSEWLSGQQTADHVTP